LTPNRQSDAQREHDWPKAQQKTATAH